MAQTVKLRRSAIGGSKPTNAQIELGELAMNTTDGKVFMAKSGSGGPSVEELIVTNTVNTGSINISGSINLEGGQIVTGSINVTGWITGSLLGSASYATLSTSASYALNATSSSYAFNSTTSSYLNNLTQFDSRYVNVNGDTMTSDLIVSGNILTTGYIGGPVTFTIDPAAIGDATGKVVILGDLQVDGTTTSVNSNEVTIADKNILLASGSANASEANGGGITIDGANANLIYASANDRWEVNKSFATNNQLISTVSVGTAPLVVTSTTLVNNLNADVLDNQHGSYYLNYGNFTNTPTIGDGTINISGSAGVSGSGTFTLNQTGNLTINLAHSNTSSQSSSDNSGRTYIQDVLLDTYGHITGLTTATETVTDTTYTDGNGIGLAGTEFSVAAGNGLTQEVDGLAHADTSTQTSINNRGNTVIQDITLDTYGHVTALGSATINSVTSSSYATTASYALSASYASNASTAGSATTATSSSYALVATSASYATNASTAGSATTATSSSYALVATSASYATNAGTAGSATTATSSSYALVATSSSYATTATSASYATNAGTANSATTATSATSATSASYATNAGTSTTAVSATSSSYASNAGTANSATTATTATSASYATNAGTANSATTATTATSASYATNAGTANSATTATSATSATSASYATNADTLDTLHSTSFLRSNATDSASGVISFTNATASTTKDTGAVIITAGGLGVEGAINAGGDIVAYASSDKRLKDNIKEIENPIDKLKQIRGVTWDWNDNADDLQKTLPNVGVVAQEIETVFPQLVRERPDGYKAVDYEKLVAVLIETNKELLARVEELEKKIKG